MIDLRATRQDMLAAIGARDAENLAVLGDPLREEFYQAPRVRLDVVGHERDDLFPLLKVALAARFPGVAPDTLTRDLLAPFKNALGNAFKRGNERDRAKSIGVSVDVTRNGVVLAVTDQGAGFDVVRTLERYRSEESYFDGYGAGFRAFDRSGSLVSYTDGGRTFLLCFKSPAATDTAVAMTATEATVAMDTNPAIQFQSDSVWQPDAAFRARLHVALVEPGSGLAARRRPSPSSPPLQLDDLVLFGPTLHDPALRCVVRCGSEAETATMVLTGWRLASRAAARADFDTRRSILARVELKKLRIPEPIVCLEQDQVAFSAFDPWMDLWWYVSERGNARALLRLGEHLGVLLRALHHAPVHDMGVRTLISWPSVVEGWRNTGERAVSFVAATVPERRDGVSKTLDALVGWAGGIVPPALVLTHGEFGADSIHYGVDGRYYLSRFDSCRASHPGIDVGSAVADLLLLARSLTLAGPPPPDPELRAAFARPYFGDDAVDWEEDVRYFVVAALLAHLARRPAWPVEKVRVALDLCDRALARSF